MTTRPIKRLIWFVGGNLTYSGGGERLMLEGLRHFRSRGLEVALFTDGIPFDPKRLFDGVYQVTVLDAPAPAAPSLRERIQGRIPLFKDMLWLERAGKAMAAFRPDAIVANSQFAAGFLLKMEWMGLLRGVPCYCFIHGSMYQFKDDVDKYSLSFRRKLPEILAADPVYRATVPPTGPRMGPKARLKWEYYVAAYKLAVRRARAVFVLTPMNKREIETLFGTRNVRVAHGAFPRAIFGARLGRDRKPDWGFAGRKVIISICRLEEKKRVDLILRAFSLLHRRDPSTALVIGGTGQARASLEALAAELGVTPAVRFAGFIPDADLHDFYMSADAFTSADIADYDITSMVSLALGCRTVVSSQHDFEPHLAGLGQLFAVDPTPEGFADGFARALAAPAPCDPATRSRLLDDYTWEAYFDSILAVMGAPAPGDRSAHA
jgi:glycosyltransferase involved in cell wall biosynthesis